MTRIEITTCEEALRVLAAHLDGELDNAVNTELERHLALCRTCFSRAEFERRLKQQLRTLAHEPVEPHLTRRIRKLIGEFAVPPAD
jgi:anti-sigma factor (TIGR02949 family)